MSLRFVRPFTVGAILLLLLIMTASPSVAASRQQPATKPPTPQMTFGHFTTVHVTANAVLPTSPDSGPHYLYADDGTSPDSIDVWKIGTTLTHVGNFPDNANNDSGIYNATSRLAVATADKAHGNCLLQADGNNDSPPGFINSYPINSDGSLGSQVSHLQAQTTGGPTGDVHVSGDTAYLDNQNADFESYSIGTGCVLAFEHSAPQTGTVVDFALLGKELFAPNCSTDSFDIYKLGAGGTITSLNSTPSQASCPDGVAAGSVKTKTGTVNNVFSGQSITSPATVEGGQLDKKTGVVTYLTGSPATDSSGQLGLATVYDSNDGLLISGEAFSNAVGVYTVKHGKPGTPGSISFLAHVALPSSSEPEVLVQFHETLFVLSFNGVVNSCMLAKTGVTGCAVAATTTSASLASGLATL
jgi:hypothetical protein